jgi:predicted HTH domain antitoxin
MSISLTMPELNIKEDELKILLASKLLEDGFVSLGKAAEIAGYSEKVFAEILIHKKAFPIKYQDINLSEELSNA